MELFAAGACIWTLNLIGCVNCAKFSGEGGAFPFLSICEVLSVHKGTTAYSRADELHIACPGDVPTNGGVQKAIGARWNYRGVDIRPCRNLFATMARR